MIKTDGGSLDKMDKIDKIKTVDRACRHGLTKKEWASIADMYMARENYIDECRECIRYLRQEDYKANAHEILANITEIAVMKKLNRNLVDSIKTLRGEKNEQK